MERQHRASTDLRYVFPHCLRGHCGRNLYHDYQLNQCNPTSFTTATVAPAYPACLPFYAINPNITTVDSRNSTGKSHYNAMQLELQKRAGRGLTFTAAYTWSKMMDNINNPIDSYAYREELDTANWQRNNYPQSLVLSYVYELPFGRNKEWLASANGWTNALVGGWAFTGITSFRSGAPLLVTASASDLLPQNGGQRADYGVMAKTTLTPMRNGLTPLFCATPGIPLRQRRCRRGLRSQVPGLGSGDVQGLRLRRE